MAHVNMKMLYMLRSSDTFGHGPHRMHRRAIDNSTEKKGRKID